MISMFPPLYAAMREPSTFTLPPVTKRFPPLVVKFP